MNPTVRVSPFAQVQETACSYNHIGYPRVIQIDDDIIHFADLFAALIQTVKSSWLDTLAGFTSPVTGTPGVASVGISVAVSAIYMLTGTWAQDHGAFGTVHIGIGTSANIGGTTKAACHFDGMMYRPTIKLDGRVVLEDGELRF